MFVVYVVIVAVLLYLLLKPKANLKVHVPTGPLKGEHEFLPFTLVHKFENSHDTKTFRFQLNPDQALGLPIGQHVIIKESLPTTAHPEGELTQRKYTPVSGLNDKGYFDLLVKIYQPTPEFPDGGLMSRWLDSLELGSIVHMSGPKGSLSYQGGGEFHITQGEKLGIRKVKRLGMVAGGTGITPCYQILNYVAKHPKEKLEMFLIYGSRTEEDILLRAEIDTLSRSGKVKVYYILDKPNEGWTGGAGYVTQEMLETHLPTPGRDVLIVHCGPPRMNVSVRKSLQAIGHGVDSIFKF